MPGVACKLPMCNDSRLGTRKQEQKIYRRLTNLMRAGATGDWSCSRGTDSPPPRSRDQAPGPNFGSGVFFEAQRVERVLGDATEALDRSRGDCRVIPNRCRRSPFGNGATATMVGYPEETGGTP